MLRFRPNTTLSRAEHGWLLWAWNLDRSQEQTPSSVPGLDLLSPSGLCLPQPLAVLLAAESSPQRARTWHDEPHPQGDQERLRVQRSEHVHQLGATATADTARQRRPASKLHKVDYAIKLQAPVRTEEIDAAPAPEKMALRRSLHPSLWVNRSTRLDEAFDVGVDAPMDARRRARAPGSARGATNGSDTFGAEPLPVRGEVGRGTRQLRFSPHVPCDTGSALRAEQPASWTKTACPRANGAARGRACGRAARGGARAC